MPYSVSCTAPVETVKISHSTAWAALAKAQELRRNAAPNVQVRDDRGKLVELSLLAVLAVQEGR